MQNRGGDYCGMRFSPIVIWYAFRTGSTNDWLCHHLALRTRDLPYTAVESILRERRCSSPQADTHLLMKPEPRHCPKTRQAKGGRGRGERNNRGGEAGAGAVGLQRWGWRCRQRRIIGIGFWFFDIWFWYWFWFLLNMPMQGTILSGTS